MTIGSRLSNDAPAGRSRAARLDATIRALDKRTAIALVAPPGFGKSLELHRMRRREITRGRRVILLDPAGEHDADGIVDRVAAAIGINDSNDPIKRAGDRLQRLLDQIDAPVTLLIDNADQLPDDGAAMLSRLLIDQRGDWRLVLAGRALPSDIDPVRLVAYGALTIVGTTTLAFTTAEALDLFVMPDADDAALRHAIDAAAFADGWPVVLDAARQRSTSQNVSMDVWLDRHCWPTLSLDQRDFAARLAVLAGDRLERPLVAAVTDHADADRLISELRQDTPFLRVDVSGHLYLRPFAADYLSRRHAESDTARQHRHVSAAMLLHATDRGVRAIFHAIAAGRGDLTSPWIAQSLRDAVATGNVAEALDWLDHLTLKQQQQQLQEADVVIWVIWALSIGGLIDRAREWLDWVATRTDGAAPVSAHELAVIEALLATIADDPDSALASLAPFRTASTEAVAQPILAVRENCFRWIDQQVFCSEVEVAKRLDEGRSRRDPRHFYSYCFAAFRDAQSLLHLGRSGEAIRLLKPLRTMAEADCGRASAPFQLFSATLAAAHLQRGNQFEARVHLASLSESAGALTIPDALWLTRSTAAMLAADQGDWRGAVDLLAELEQEAERRRLPRLAALSLTLTVRTLIRAAEHQLLEDALVRLKKVYRAVSEQSPINGALTRLAAAIGLAHGSQALGDEAQANGFLAEATGLAIAHNRLIDLAEAALLSRAGLDDSVLIDAADRAALITALRPMTAPRPQAQLKSTPTPTLTAKEREILSLLATGIANRSIAEAMMVSVETIKWHLKNIFNKLGVHDREHVIARVHEFPLEG